MDLAKIGWDPQRTLRLVAGPSASAPPEFFVSINFYHVFLDFLHLIVMVILAMSTLIFLYLVID